MQTAQGECILQTMIDHEDKAGVFARGLVEARLAACVTRMPAGISVYRFESADITIEPEHLLLIKTHTDKLPEIESYFKEHHPYSVPEMLVFPASHVSEAFSRWLREEMRLK